MTKNISWLMLGTAALALVACGKKDDDGKMDAEETPDVAQQSASADDVQITIPDAPQNPIIEINAEKSANFLTANGAKDGVRTLDNGLQIEFTEPGEGDTPVSGDIVRFHYTGKYIDGSVFDDSRVLDEPLVVPSIDQLPIPGLPQALAEMKEGGKATVAVPPSLAFGEEGLPGVFEPNTTLVFDVELIEVVTTDEPERRAEIEAEQERLIAEARAEADAQQAEAQAAFAEAASGNLASSDAFLAEVSQRDGVTTTDSGLRFEVIEDGGQGATPDPWDTVELHYHGTLPDGSVFDSSVERGEPIEYPLNGFVPGFTEGVGKMNVGDKYKIYIPPAIGYGERGTPGGPIGPNQAIVFEVELLNITENDAPASE